MGLIEWIGCEDMEMVRSGLWVIEVFNSEDLKRVMVMVMMKEVLSYKFLFPYSIPVSKGIEIDIIIKIRLDVSQLRLVS